MGVAILRASDRKALSSRCGCNSFGPKACLTATWRPTMFLWHIAQWQLSPLAYRTVAGSILHTDPVPASLSPWPFWLKVQIGLMRSRKPVFAGSSPPAFMLPSVNPSGRLCPCVSGLFAELDFMLFFICLRILAIFQRCTASLIGNLLHKF